MTAGGGSDSTGRSVTGGRGAIARKGVPVYVERRGSDAIGNTGAASASIGRPAARETVPAKVCVGSVVLVGSLAQPSIPVYFDLARCASVPEVGGTTNGGAVDALIWWDVFSERTVCNAVQLFASPDCSGAAAAKHLFNGYMSVTKISPSVKSIRCVLDNICSRVKCPQHSTCIKTNDRQEVACQCAQGYRNVYGQCQPR